MTPYDPAAASPASEEGAAGRSPVVFFVDDDVDVRALTQKVLEGGGYRVIEAGSAEEAGKVVDTFDGWIDVLLMDINLPDGWGGTLAQGLLLSRPGMVVVYTTGAAAGDAVLSGGLKDAALVLPKPFSPAELLSVVGEAVSRGKGPG